MVDFSNDKQLVAFLRKELRLKDLEILELKEQIRKNQFPSYLDHLKVSTLSGRQ